MMSEYWPLNAKYSVLRQLWLKRFPEWAFRPLNPDGEPVASETQFHLSYPVGDHVRPCIGVAYTGSVRGGASKGLGNFTETSQLIVYVLGAGIIETELWGEWVKRELDSKRVPLYEWQPAKKDFGPPFTLGLEPMRFLSVKMKDVRTGTDKPEAELAFHVVR